MVISDTSILDIQEHAIEEFPKESVGVLVNGLYKRLTNAHPEPNASFKVKPAEYKKAVGKSKDVVLVHSHPFDTGEDATMDRYFRYLQFDRRTPSKSDMQTAQSMAIPCAIVATNGQICSNPLVFNDGETHSLRRREFVHGVFDCWTAVRDYYKQTLDVELPNPPREFNWWHDDPEADMYGMLDELGFIEVSLTDIQEHDVILFSIDTDMANHAAVYVDMDKIFHHLYGQLSCRESLNKHEQYITRIMRYQHDGSNPTTDS